MQKQHQLQCFLHKSPINFICLQDNCRKQQQQVLCQQCFQQHNLKYAKHRLIQYQEFKMRLIDLKKHLNYEHLIEVFQHQITNLKNSVNRILSELEDLIMTPIRLDLHQQLQEQVFKGQISMLTNNTILKRFIEQPKNIKQIEKQTTALSIKVAKNLRKIDQDFKDIVQKCSNESNYNSIQKGIFTFSQKQKNRSIQISKKKTIMSKITRQGMGHCQLALCNEPFNPMNNEVTFKIEQITRLGCIALGACLKDPVSARNYYKCWHLGQGTYSIFLNTFGQVKSNHHSIKKHSSDKIYGMKLKSKDEVSISIDFMTQKITFKINKNQCEYTMPIDIDQGRLYPFVAVSYLGDSVSIK